MRGTLACLLGGMAGYALVPWYALSDSFWRLSWLAGWATGRDVASALVQAARFHRPWLWLPLLPLLLAATGLVLRGRAERGLVLTLAGAVGLLVTFGQGFAIGLRGWSWPFLADLLGRPLDEGQGGMGIGALVVVAAFVLLLAQGLALRGAFRGDAFVASAVAVVLLLVTLFTVFPLVRVLASAVQTRSNEFSVAALGSRILAEKIWSVGCLFGGSRCGVAWNTLFLALLTATGTTALGLAFALIVTRTTVRVRGLLRVLTVLPIITPPFVIGLSLILVFGRAGLVNQLLERLLDIPPSRWIYGFQGVWMAQLFAFTPVAFLVLLGVVQGVSPTLEEAAQTLRADRWQTFSTVSLPLMRPGLANAFLVGFVESIADFGNPIVLGGNFAVLSTEIFFSVVGAQLDHGRAAALALILLAFALGAFMLQRRVLGRRLYTGVSGKGDAGVAAPLPNGVRRLTFAVAIPWAALTAFVYALALAGGFAEVWGRDFRPTLRHYAKAFAIESTPHGLLWSGSAWHSLWTTLELASVAAPLTAALGLLIAYVLVRQPFHGRSVFEFVTMLSFAIPGTVIGLSYIFAFNVPPLELTGTGAILVICFIFRNMPVGIRAGVAAMSQIDPSLDEASLTLGGGSATTLRRVILPLLRPALVAALVYSFVRAMTTVSAVIFLVSAEYDLATTYIINRVVNGDYGVAIAYSSVLIVLMLAAILLIQLLVGERRLGRRVPATLAAGARAS